ncbi:MAG: hypothetical protein LQ352_004917 [Teloschistes flavicans]|nr:MAG: hypothetical protein LQ352_004917 [Teloschistes flavicans]
MARSKIVKPRKAAKDATAVAPKDINGDVTPTNELSPKESNSPRSTRKRTGDFNDFEDDPTAPDGQDIEPVADAVSQPKKKSKLASGAEKKIKPSGGKPPKTISEGTTKPSKTDGHPILTEKTHPGGDTVEVEPAEETKAQKKNPKSEGKKKASGKAKSISKEGPSKVSGRAISGAKETKSKDNTNTDEATPQIDTGDTASRPSISKIKKDVKSKPKSKQAKNATQAEPEEDTTTKPAASESGKATKESKEAQGKVSDQAPAEETATVAPEEAMDEAPFKKLLKRERTKIPSVKASAQKAEEERKAAVAASKKEAKAKREEEKASKAKASESTSKNNQEPGHADAAPSATADDTPNKAVAGKKRKDGPESADAKANSGPSGKKQKKSTSSALEAAKNAVGDLVNSGIEAAAQGVSAVKEFAAGFENKSIADDVTAVAEGVVEEKSKNKRATKATKPSDEKSKKGKGKAKADVEEADPPAGEDVAFDDESGEDDFEEVDQTAALIKGFESDGDEAEPSDSAGFKEGTEVPQIPKKKELSKKLKAAKDDSDGPGVIYVGRIPHGFYEPQMRAYFSQFGPINRLRLSRNRTTGASKHYAFIEFESEAVSRIVAETMDTYLMFGHILKCKTVAPEQVHDNLWKGANKRFKAVPWSKIEGRKMEKAVGRDVWEKRVKAEQKRRKVKGEKLKAVGYEFEAGLKGVGEVPVREAKKTIAAAGEKQEEEGGAKGIETVEEKTVVVTEGGEGGRTVLQEEVTTKRVRKGTAKRKAMEEEEGKGPLKEIVKKAKKAKKDVAA